LTAQAVQTAQELSPPLQGICLPGDNFSIAAQFEAMSIADIVIVMPGMELSLPAGTAQDGPTPLRKIPSAKAKAAICFPKQCANIIRTLYAGTRWIKDGPAG
jgi:hypothetical protein